MKLWHIVAKVLRVVAVAPTALADAGIRAPVAAMAAAPLLAVLADVLDPEADTPHVVADGADVVKPSGSRL